MHAFAEVGTVVPGVLGLTTLVTFLGMVPVDETDAPGLGALVALSILWSLTWPAAWVALLAGRVVPAAVLGVPGGLPIVLAFLDPNFPPGPVVPAEVAVALGVVARRVGPARTDPPLRPVPGVVVLLGGAAVLGVLQALRGWTDDHDREAYAAASPPAGRPQERTRHDVRPVGGGRLHRRSATDPQRGGTMYVTGGLCTGRRLTTA